MTITNDSKIYKTDNFVESDIEGQTVMMSIENSKYFGMDEIGTSIWNNLTDSISFSQLIEKLLEEYDIDREICEKDTRDYLDRLLDFKLIKIA